VCLSAAEIVFKAGKTGSSNKNSMTLGDVTISVSGKSDLGGTYYSLAKDREVVVSTSKGKITKIVFTCMGNNKSTYGPGWLTGFSTGTYSYSDKIGTWQSSVLSDTVKCMAKQMVHATGIAVTVVEDNASQVRMDEQEDELSFVAGSASVSLYRSFHADAWNSLVLPFSLSADEVRTVFGPHTVVAAYTGPKSQPDGSYTLCFDTSECVIHANTPVFIRGMEQKACYEIPDATIVPGTPEIIFPTFGLIGSYRLLQLNAGDYFISSDNRLYQAIGTEELRPTRAVFRVKSGETAPKRVRVSVGGTVTGIERGVQAETNSFVPMYNSNGQRVDASYRGVVICSGKKVLR